MTQRILAQQKALYIGWYRLGVVWRFGGDFSLSNLCSQKTEYQHGSLHTGSYLIKAFFGWWF